MKKLNRREFLKTTAATALHDVKTIPQGLKGYDTAFIGKWHMGSHNHEGYRPEDQGFDETLAYFDGGGSGYHREIKGVRYIYLTTTLIQIQITSNYQRLCVALRGIKNP